jgi:hypothetical protein
LFLRATCTCDGAAESRGEARRRPAGAFSTHGKEMVERAFDRSTEEAGNSIGGQPFGPHLPT